MQWVSVGVFSRTQSKAWAMWSTVVQALKLRRIMRGAASSGDGGQDGDRQRGDDDERCVASAPRRRLRRLTPFVCASWRA